MMGVQAMDGLDLVMEPPMRRHRGNDQYGWAIVMLAVVVWVLVMLALTYISWKVVIPWLVHA